MELFLPLNIRLLSYNERFNIAVYFSITTHTKQLNINYTAATIRNTSMLINIMKTQNVNNHWNNFYCHRHLTSLNQHCLNYVATSTWKTSAIECLFNVPFHQRISVKCSASSCNMLRCVLSLSLHSAKSTAASYYSTVHFNTELCPILMRSMSAVHKKKVVAFLHYQKIQVFCIDCRQFETWQHIFSAASQHHVTNQVHVKARSHFSTSKEQKQRWHYSILLEIQRLMTTPNRCE